MNILELIREVQTQTSLGEFEIRQLIRRNWPNHSRFSGTQAALLVQYIRKGQR